MTVVEDYEPDANIPGTEDPPAGALSTEDLPEISAWGPKESIADLKFGDGLSNRFRNYGHLHRNIVLSSPTALAIRTWLNTTST